MADRWTVWALVREARRRAGLTQRELAQRAHTAQPAIARYERGRAVPDIATLARIVEACGFELRLVLGERDNQRDANEAAAAARTVEERLAANEDHTRLVHELRGG